MSVWYAIQIGPEGVVHSFEPLPWYAAVCRYQAELNHLDTIHVHQVGVGAQRKTIRVPIASSRALDYGIDDAGTRAIEIHDIADYADLKPHFMKIDIEGAEVEVVQRLSHFSNLRGLLLELHPVFIREQGVDPNEIIRTIMKYGLSVVANNIFEQPFTSETIRDDANFYLCTSRQHLDHVISGTRAPTYNHLTEHARFHLSAGDLDLAQAYADDAVARYPHRGLTHRVKGEVLFKQGDAEGAIAAAERAVALTPNDAHLWFFLSWLLGQVGDRERSIDCARTALSRDRMVPAFHHHLSIQLNELGHKVEALAAIEEALRLSPSNAGWQAYRTWLVEEELAKQQNAIAAMREPEMAEISGLETGAPIVAEKQTMEAEALQPMGGLADPSFNFAH
jgi:FkbM family methyltransferase